VELFFEDEINLSGYQPIGEMLLGEDTINV
jgi:hypothetical protein